MDKEKIECLICHKMFRRITNTHLAQAHGGLTMKKYLEKFPGALVDSADLKEKRASHFRGKHTKKYLGEKKESLSANYVEKQQRRHGMDLQKGRKR